MDLDNIKSKWNNLDVEPTISEEKIRRMVDNRGQGALSKLKKMEFIFLFTTLCCIPFPFIHNMIFVHAQYNTVLKACYIATCLIMFCWQMFKFRYLKNIDFEKQDILTSSKKILRYKMYISYEKWGGAVFAILFMSSFTYTIIGNLPEYARIYFIIYTAIIIAAILFIVFLFYKKTYRKFIQQIQDSLKEIEDFETE
ncbi:hypothetical protein [Dysgonomonas sp. 520]|uniref:hypothetical protein n=1 Tax=Dysgonomonas sp. 520 TaxID=2302931 RepID=UPI0013D0A888|nr:hypothetical protein [Dysgonomonas sp. 520]NDW08536.1 hypothetical protein [Dysgonomonas sp. 520]